MVFVRDVIVLDLFHCEYRSELAVGRAGEGVGGTDKTQFPFPGCEGLIQSPCFSHECITSLNTQSDWDYSLFIKLHWLGNETFWSSKKLPPAYHTR